MKYLICLLSLFYTQQWFFAQRQLLIEVNGAYNSTTLPKRIPQAFFYGGFLDSNFLADTYQSLPQRNSFGIQMHAQFQYQTNKALHLDANKYSSSWNWLIGAGVENYTGIQFSKDAFGFVFSGAAPFIGDTLNFSNTRIQSISFSKLGFGLYNQQTQSSIQLNLIGVHNFLDAKISNASWYQDPIQDSIILLLDATARYSTNPFSAVGLGLDVDYRFSSDSDNEPLIFQLNIQNLGFAYQITPMQKVQLNGGYNYGPFDLQDIEQFQSGNIIDSALLELGFERSNIRQWTLLPASIQLSKMVNQDSSIRLQAFYGARFILRQTYTPFIFAGAHIYASKKWQTGIGAAYGGFGGLRAQAYSVLHFNKYHFLLRSDNITFQKGASIYMQIQCDL